MIPDLKRKLPGRGLWISASHQAVEEAVRRNQFRQGFQTRRPGRRDAGRRYRSLLVRSAIDALAMAAKAGQVVSGFSKVEGALAAAAGRGPVQALIHASDGAADGIRKLDAVATAKCRE